MECTEDIPAGEIASKTPGRAQQQLLMDGTAVESAFTLLLTKVTKEGLRPNIAVSGTFI